MKAAIVVNDVSLICMQVSMNEDDMGVCVHISGEGMDMWLVCVYCRFDADIHPYLDYLVRIIEYVGCKVLLICMDANVVSQL